MKSGSRKRRRNPHNNGPGVLAIGLFLVYIQVALFGGRHMPGPKPHRRKPIPDFSVDLGEFAAREYRTKQVNIKVTPSELDSVRQMAKYLKVSIADYFLGLHFQAFAAAEKKLKKTKTKGR